MTMPRPLVLILLVALTGCSTQTGPDSHNEVFRTPAAHGRVLLLGTADQLSRAREMLQKSD